MASHSQLFKQIKNHIVRNLQDIFMVFEVLLEKAEMNYDFRSRKITAVIILP